MHISLADACAVAYKHEYDLGKQSQMIVYPQQSALIIKSKSPSQRGLNNIKKLLYFGGLVYPCDYLIGRNSLCRLWRNCGYHLGLLRCGSRRFPDSIHGMGGAVLIKHAYLLPVGICIFQILLGYAETFGYIIIIFISHYV